MISRRSFLSFLVATPVIAALPAIAKYSDPLRGRRHIIGETLHVYDSVHIRDRIVMENCVVYMHHDKAAIYFHHGAANTYIANCAFIRA